MVRWLVACLVPGLAACSWVDPRTFTLPSMPAMPSVSVAPGRIVAESSTLPASELPTLAAFRQGVAAVLAAHKLTGPPAVTLLRRAPPIAPADWVACLRSYMEPAPPLAVFFSGDKLVDYRVAVLIDDCAKADYMPLPEAP
jgi:hypothetical protein